jgi:hypothetical protein
MTADTGRFKHQKAGVLPENVSLETADAGTDFLDLLVGQHEFFCELTLVIFS